jgi:hypothetical protein
LLDQQTKTGTFGGCFLLGRVDPASVGKETRWQQRQESHARLLQRETSRLEENAQMEMSFGSEVKIFFIFLF